MSRTPARDTRHMSLARALHARLCVNVEGRVFVATGQVAHAKLAQCLARQERCPTVAESPTPGDLGIPTCDGELSPDLLHAIGVALNRWLKELEVEAKRRPARRRRTACLDRDRQEIERLASRLATVRQWQAAFARGDEPAGAPFLLDSVDEARLRAALEGAQRVHALSPLIAWQARVVYWLSGDCAAQRYLSATASLLNAYPKVSRRDHIRGFQGAAMAWRLRSQQEPVRNLLAELAQHVRRLPPDVVREGRFSSRLRGRAFHAHCDLIQQRCKELLVKEELRRWCVLPAALAALVASDGSAVPLPQRCFQAAAEQDNFGLLSRTIDKLAEQIGEPGYDALLAAIDQLPESPHELEYGPLRQLLGQGASLAEAAWACAHGLVDSLTESCLKANAARRLSDAFTKRGCPLSDSYLRALVGSVRRTEDLAPIHVWMAWLGGVAPRAMTPRMQRVLGSALWRLYLPSARQRGWFQQIAPRLVPPARAKNPQDVPHLLASVSEYRRIAGKNAAMPKSLRKLMEFRESRQRERDYLQRRLATGELELATQSRRLEAMAGARPDSAKILRAAEEAYLLSGIEALDAMTRGLAEARCRKHFGDLVVLFDRGQLWDFALWTKRMTEPERDRLRAVVAARARYGRDYKRRLADNRVWISRAIVRGIDLGPWLAAEPHVQTIGGRTVEIAVADDLHRIFLMGAYFQTCLSQGEVNEMSVLANAYDANKQVVFMYTEDDAGRKQVVARQLIAISDNCELLGYCCYLSWRYVDKATRQEVVDAMASYCGRLAARCRLELANEGSPEEIGDHFWHDDGEREWPAAAQEAWSQCPPESVELAIGDC